MNKDLLNIILHGNDEEVKNMVFNVHPADILDLIHDNKINIYNILKRLPNWLIARIIDEEEDEDKYAILKCFSESEQKDILEEMSSDEITDLVGVLNENESKSILQKMSEECRVDVEKLLTYEKDTAGGIMATEFISIISDETVWDALKYLQKTAEDAESIYYLYVTDSNEYLKGVVSLSDLVCTDFNKKISSITNCNVISVKYDVDQEEAANIFEKYGFLTMPVVDDKNRLIGIITADDIIEILKEESTEDIHLLGGIDKEERVDGTLKDSIKSRLPWLFINLLTAILAAIVVASFEETISKAVALAAFMPIVTGMGGNAGTQSLTIIVRGIALGELKDENSAKILLKEVLVGITTGAALGLAIGVIAFFWVGNFTFGIVIAAAMLLNMAFATIAGYLIPVILKRLKIDPALASAIFVTTVTDILGFFFFLGLATLFIDRLL